MININEHQVLFGLDSVTKVDAVKQAGEILVRNGNVDIEYIDSMLEKEKTDVTYIGNGIAIPHGTLDGLKYIKNSGISILHYPEGIDYDGEKAYLVIGIAGKGEEHIELLQELAIKVSDIDFVNQLVNSKSIDSFIEIFNS